MLATIMTIGDVLAAGPKVEITDVSPVAKSAGDPDKRLQITYTATGNTDDAKDYLVFFYTVKRTGERNPTKINSGKIFKQWGEEQKVYFEPENIERLESLTVIGIMYDYATVRRIPGDNFAAKPAAATSNTYPFTKADYEEKLKQNAMAKSQPGTVLAPTEFGAITDLGEYAKQIMKFALPLGIALSILMTIYAGILLMLSQGSPDRVKDAQEIIQGAVLGLTILILSRLLVDFLFIPDPYDPSQTAARQQQQRFIERNNQLFN